VNILSVDPWYKNLEKHPLLLSTISILYTILWTHKWDSSYDRCIDVLGGINEMQFSVFNYIIK
jgi:hypothetical protein